MTRRARHLTRERRRNCEHPAHTALGRLIDSTHARVKLACCGRMATIRLSRPFRMVAMRLDGIQC